MSSAPQGVEREMSRIRILTVAVLACALLSTTATAQAEETVSITAAFSPDRLGAPTNVFGTATITSTTGPVPSPVTNISIFGPAGLGLDVQGVGICNPAALENSGPAGCPASSRAGFGKGIGLFELAKEVIKEGFTTDLFRGPNEGGHVTVLLYLNAVTPVSVQLVFKAPVVPEPKPYGLGFSFTIPPIQTLPGASDASLGSAQLTIGAPNAAYYEKVHGKRKLVHVKGLIVPKRCPKGGFPVQTSFSFEDGSTVVSKSTIRCPPKSRRHR
jgi:hypothetical protein